MLNRLRTALGLALLLSLLMSVTVSAKGGFDYITITGPGLKEAVTATDPTLTEDFFTFANFYEDRTKAPADPGEGYEIIRYYKEGIGARAFDRLHYFPESGLVFYDGIENGESEYDNGWYTANPMIKRSFDSALSVQTAPSVPVQEREPVTAASQAGAEDSVARAQPTISWVQSPTVLLIVAASGLAALTALTVFALWRRKIATR